MMKSNIAIVRDALGVGIDHPRRTTDGNQWVALDMIEQYIETQEKIIRGLQERLKEKAA